ncbi:MAG: ABC transporter permease [Anaerolineales bacterium]|nr:ABC transporter permease [Anaerolineales bacterium]
MRFTRLLAAEMRRELKRAQAYWVDVLADQLLFTLVFLFLSGIIHLLTEGDYAAGTLLAALIGFVTWRIADGCILRITDSLAEDAKTGTLEQIYLSSPQPALILFARSLAILVYHSFRGLLLAIILLLVLQIPGKFSWMTIFIFGLTQIGAIGVAYGIAGLHLVYKNVTSITLALSTVLLFLTGAVTPLDNAPLLFRLTQLLPLTTGIGLLRQALIDDVSLATMLRQTELYWLLLNSSMYGLIGWAIFRWGQNAARKHGSLAHY